MNPVLILAALLFAIGIYFFIQWKAPADLLRNRVRELDLFATRLEAVAPLWESYLPGQEVDDDVIFSIMLGKVEPRYAMKNFARNGDGPRSRGRVQQRWDARQLEGNTVSAQATNRARRL